MNAAMTQAQMIRYGILGFFGLCILLMMVKLLLSDKGRRGFILGDRR